LRKEKKNARKEKLRKLGKPSVNFFVEGKK